MTYKLKECDKKDLFCIGYLLFFSVLIVTIVLSCAISQTFLLGLVLLFPVSYLLDWSSKDSTGNTYGWVPDPPPHEYEQ